MYTLFWLVSFTGPSDLGIIHAAECVDELPIGTPELYSIRWVRDRWFIHLPVNTHVSCFQFGAVTNKADCPCEHMLFLLGTHLGIEWLDHCMGVF